MLNWQPMTDEDWWWVNYGTLPQKDKSEKTEEEKG
jgi:hypothetical protein